MSFISNAMNIALKNPEFKKALDEAKTEKTPGDKQPAMGKFTEKQLGNKDFWKVLDQQGQQVGYRFGDAEGLFKDGKIHNGSFFRNNNGILDSGFGDEKKGVAQFVTDGLDKGSGALGTWAMRASEWASEKGKSLLGKINDIRKGISEGTLTGDKMKKAFRDLVWPDQATHQKEFNKAVQDRKDLKDDTKKAIGDATSSAQNILDGILGADKSKETPDAKKSTDAKDKKNVDDKNKADKTENVDDADKGNETDKTKTPTPKVDVDNTNEADKGNETDKAELLPKPREADLSFQDKIADLGKDENKTKAQGLFDKRQDLAKNIDSFDLGKAINEAADPQELIGILTSPENKDAIEGLKGNSNLTDIFKAAGLEK